MGCKYDTKQQDDANYINVNHADEDHKFLLTLDLAMLELYSNIYFPCYMYQQHEPPFEQYSSFGQVKIYAHWLILENGCLLYINNIYVSCIQYFKPLSYYTRRKQHLPIILYNTLNHYPAVRDAKQHIRILYTIL